jgi:hypothetical protein
LRWTQVRLRGALALSCWFVAQRGVVSWEACGRWEELQPSSKAGIPVLAYLCWHNCARIPVSRGLSWKARRGACIAVRCVLFNWHERIRCVACGRILAGHCCKPLQQPSLLAVLTAAEPSAVELELLEVFAGGVGQHISHQTKLMWEVRRADVPLACLCRHLCRNVFIKGPGGPHLVPGLHTGSLFTCGWKGAHLAPAAVLHAVVCLPAHVKMRSGKGSGSALRRSRWPS